jgi:4-hydroxy-tetrahydrodipicolinate synthase
VPFRSTSFPALSGVPYRIDLVKRLSNLFGKRIAGLKDSSGDVEYARAIASLSTTLAVFPSNEATFLQDQSGAFAGCISATANLNSELCAHALYTADDDAMTKAVRVRALFDGRHLVPSVKAVLARALDAPAIADVLSPFVKVPDTESLELFGLYREALRG